MGLNNENSPSGAGRWMAVDIETVPMVGLEAYLTEPIEPPSNYKDPEKIAAYIAQKRQEQIDRAGLDLDLCEVVCIAGQFADRGWVQTRETASEAELISGLWRFVATLQREGADLVGFNLLGFDLLVLLRRSLYLGIVPPPIRVDRYRHEGVVDVLDVLSFGRRELMRSLSFYCKRFGIAHDDTITGKDIAPLVAAGEWAKVAAHCADDARATAELAVRIGAV